MTFTKPAELLSDEPCAEMRLVMAMLARHYAGREWPQPKPVVFGSYVAAKQFMEGTPNNMNVLLVGEVPARSIMEARQFAPDSWKLTNSAATGGVNFNVMPHEGPRNTVEFWSAGVYTVPDVQVPVSLTTCIHPEADRVIRDNAEFGICQMTFDGKLLMWTDACNQDLHEHTLCYRGSAPVDARVRARGERLARQLGGLELKMTPGPVKSERKLVGPQPSEAG